MFLSLQINSEPSKNSRMRSAVIICPLCGRAKCIKGSNGSIRPSKALKTWHQLNQLNMKVYEL